MKHPLPITSPKPFATSNILSQIFPTSSQKFPASLLSENRYPKQISDIHPQDDYQGKLLNYSQIPSHPPPRHRRRSSHQRTCSIYIPASQDPIQVLSKISEPRTKSVSTRTNSKGVSEGSLREELNQKVSSQDVSGCNFRHKRNISDADSVVYIGAGQDQSMQKINDSLYSAHSKENTIVFCSKESPQVRKRGEDRGSRHSLRESLPILGRTPVCTFCKFCKIEVHTVVEFNSVKVPRKVLKILGSVFNCCSGPDWLNKLVVHKCPNCQLVLAKSRQEQ